MQPLYLAPAIILVQKLYAESVPYQEAISCDLVLSYYIRRPHHHKVLSQFFYSNQDAANE
jgi:hypothetical protein